MCVCIRENNPRAIYLPMTSERFDFEYHQSVYLSPAAGRTRVMIRYSLTIRRFRENGTNQSVYDFEYIIVVVILSARSVDGGDDVVTYIV